ncbi:flippase [Methanothermococcus sp. SCGC AD-155-C09]|nr:flippase [Methanothermococcus sp. SCGC AD-155-C09]
MNEIQKILKNISVLSLARIVSMLFSFFYVMYTARYLGPANYGILAFALALNSIVGVIANFGLDPLTVREVARDKNLADKYLVNGIVLKVLFGCLTFLIIFVVVNILGYPEITKKVIYIITAFTIISGISNLFNNIYQAFERMEFISIGQILQSILLLAFAIVGIKFGFDVIYFALIYLAVNLIVLCYNIIVTLWKFLIPKIEVDFGFWKSVVKEAWPFALSSVFVGMYYYTDSVMVGFIKGNFDVGIYNAAYRLSSIFLLVPQIYSLVIFPTLSKKYIKDLEKFRLISLFYTWTIGSLGILISIIGYLIAPFLILLVYGNEYILSIEVFKILILSIGLSYFTYPLGLILDASNYQKINMNIMFFSIVLNIFLNYIFINFYGVVGAAIATLITRTVFLIARYLIVRRKKLIEKCIPEKKDVYEAIKVIKQIRRNTK